MDSLLENLMPKEYERSTVVEGLKTYSTRKSDMWKSIKFKAHTPDFEEILWKEKFSKEDLIAIRDDYVDRGLPDVYSQEYLNIPIDEATAYFKKHDFLAITNEDRTKPLNYYITADLAISEKERADYSAIVVGGIDEHNILQIRHIIKARMDGQEIVETLIQLQRIYNPLVVGIEETQISKALGPFLRERMVETGVFLNVVPLIPHRTDKELRARSIQARMRAKSVKFDKEADWYPELEDEMMKFPRSRHDDQVDAIAYLGLLIDKFISAPTSQEIAEEEYEDEKRQSAFGMDGRSLVCGY